ncbi:MAG: hypothetical protein VR66_25880 [Peptococcaceae bacterium BRH_c23]|nr:MAG: hypothetical protein VR66_25880 [Peptococcaceae bacterium BRH_c23]KJS89621.1 MAG: hypothetical protein JL57_05960 [Desulfosporosinus sp. BICA1-9]HBW39161.1 hypothetical protein [Desulfosporosinus sp.]
MKIPLKNAGIRKLVKKRQIDICQVYPQLRFRMIKGAFLVQKTIFLKIFSKNWLTLYGTIGIISL